MPSASSTTSTTGTRSRRLPLEPDGKLIESFGVPVRAIAGVLDLMQHKFVVRDRDAVTGSMNWTDDCSRDRRT